VGECGVCYIVPNSKGSSVIRGITRERANGDENKHIDSINDIRNGIMLTSGLRRSFGEGGIAFLKTPNFALDTADVPKVDPVRELGNTELPIDGAGGRYTLQHFPGVEFTIALLAPANADAWIPESLDERERPSQLLLDFWYGAAALQAWGQDSFQSYIKEHGKLPYYPPQGNDEDHDKRVVSKRPHVVDSSIKKGRGLYRRRRRAAESRMGKTMNIMRFFLATAGREEEFLAKKEEEEKQYAVEKVNDWLRGGVDSESTKEVR